MSFFKDPVGELHFLDDDGFQHLLPTGCVPISDVEARAIQAAAQPSAAEIARAETLAKIAALEATQARAVRTATLLGDLTYLQAIEDQISVLRKTL